MWRPRERKDFIEGIFPPLELYPELKPAALEHVLTTLAFPPTILILALQRTGSKSAFHYFYSEFSKSSKVLHAHGLSHRFRRTLRSPEKQKQAARTDTILHLGGATTIIVPVREPVARIYSFFLYANREQISDHFNKETQEFRESAAIEEDFLAFCISQARVEELWYKEELLNPFGFDLLSVPPDMAGAHVSSVRGRTFIVLRCEAMANTIAEAARKVVGATLRPLQSVNTSAELGLGALASAFRRQFPFPEAAMDLLRRNPYCQHLYPLPTKYDGGMGAISSTSVVNLQQI